MMPMQNLFRNIPSADIFLQRLKKESKLAAYSYLQIKNACDLFFQRCRQDISDGYITQPEALTLEALYPRLHAFLCQELRPHFRRVLNGTGVVLHTNLGRALLPPEAETSLWERASRYSNLEFSLQTGQRGSRYAHVQELLCQLTGAESALVVNNNAAAVLLVLNTLTQGKEAIISRGQLVEIGGSFRIPEVMEKSGALLREVGATNRTHLTDYVGALSENTGLLMKVHTSNYRIVGFHKEVSLQDLVLLGQKHRIPVFEDLGSGSFFDFSAHGLAFEPTVPAAVKTGVDVLSFSGDKLLGGPQAGIIVGRSSCLERIKANPLNRALRIDKLTLSALESVLTLYCDPQTVQQKIPTLAMICASFAELEEKAQALEKVLSVSLGEYAHISLIAGTSQVGGGAFPGQDLPTTLVRIVCAYGPEALREALLRVEVPVIGRVEKGAFCLDPRTLSPEEYGMVAEALKAALTALAACSRYS